MEQEILPVYFLVDVSMAMERSGFLASLNAELQNFRDQIASDSVVGDTARFAVVTFSSTAEMVLPLSDLLEVETMPTLSPATDANFRSAFEFMSGCIPHDMEWFSAKGYKPYRPLVFFITGGLPTDSENEPWEPAYRALVDPAQPYRPDVVSVGFGAKLIPIRKIATHKAYVARDAQKLSALFSAITGALDKWFSYSAILGAREGLSFFLPQRIDDMHELFVGNRPGPPIYTND